MSVEKDDGAQRLVLAGGGQSTLDGQVREKRGDVGPAQRVRQDPSSGGVAVKAKELLDPAEVLLPGRVGQMCPPTGAIKSLKQLHGGKGSTMLGWNKYNLAIA